MVNQPNNQSTLQNPVGRFMVAIGAVIQLAGTDKFLLIQRAGEQDWRGGEWEIIYGRIDQFEDCEKGLHREVREETGLTEITVHETLRVWHIFRGPELAENEVIGITFRCTTPRDSVTLSQEHTAYRWVTVDEALELVRTPGIREDIKRFSALK
jgi:8-oxo-dGTP diphosphatase